MAYSPITNYGPGSTLPPVMPQLHTLTEVYGTQVPRPKTFAQWVASAKENLHKIKQDGSPSPLVWVRSDKSNSVSTAPRSQHVF